MRGRVRGPRPNPRPGSRLSPAGTRFDLLGIYGAGVLTFVTPCVLPLIPIYLAALVGGAGVAGARGRLMLRAGLFALGFLLVFTLLGLTASTLGGALVAQHHVLGVPTFLVLDRDARFVTKLVGVRSEAALEAAVRDLAAGPCPAGQYAPVEAVPSCAATPHAAPTPDPAAPAACSQP